MRYELKPETYKHGRKTESQWVIWDTLENRAFARFATEKQAQDLLDRWKTAQLNAENSAK